MDKKELIKKILLITQSADELGVNYTDDEAMYIDNALTEIQQLCEAEDSTTP